MTKKWPPVWLQSSADTTRPWNSSCSNPDTVKIEIWVLLKQSRDMTTTSQSVTMSYFDKDLILDCVYKSSRQYSVFLVDFWIQKYDRKWWHSKNVGPQNGKIDHHPSKMSPTYFVYNICNQHRRHLAIFVSKRSNDVGDKMSALMVLSINDWHLNLSPTFEYCRWHFWFQQFRSISFGSTL